VEGLVDRLVAEFNEDLAIFETLQEEFDSFLEQHRKRVELAERRAAEAQRGRERLEQARAVASMELAMLMGAREAPEVIDSFLRRSWTHHLALVILREGTDSERFTQARACGERVWQAMLACESGLPQSESLGPILEPVLASSGVTAESAQEIVAAIESLLNAMRIGDRAGVAAAKLPGAEKVTQLHDLGDSSSEAAPLERQAPASNVVHLRAGSGNELQRALSAEAAVETPPPAKVTERGTSSHFAAFWEESKSETAEPAAPVEAVAPTLRGVEPDSPSLAVVAGNDTIAADPEDLEKIRKLEVGNWIELIGEDGVPQPAKLSWVSPISSRLLFVNRRGMRVCAASAEELAMMLKQGKMNLREIDTAFERAMTQVLGKLRETQGQRSA
jgi:hypothetical protein